MDARCCSRPVAGSEPLRSPEWELDRRLRPGGFPRHPFRVAWNEEAQPMLCVDEASGLIAESGEGEVFFDDNGELSASVQQVWAFLQDTAKSEAILANACGQLHAAGVIEPWPITIQGETGSQQIA